MCNISMLNYNMQIGISHICTPAHSHMRTCRCIHYTFLIRTCTHRNHQIIHWHHTHTVVCVLISTIAVWLTCIPCQCTHIHMYTNIHTHMNTRTYTHTNTHTHPPAIEDIPTNVQFCRSLSIFDVSSNPLVRYVSQLYSWPEYKAATTSTTQQSAFVTLMPSCT